MPGSDSGGDGDSNTAAMRTASPPRLSPVDEGERGRLSEERERGRLGV